MTNNIAPLVLVIEDDPDLGQLYVKLVRLAAGEPELCADGAEALARIKRDPIPSILFVDLHLPNANGEEIIRAAKADPRLAQTLAVVVTVDPEWAKRMEDLKIADGVLLKPVEFPIYSTWIQRSMLKQLEIS